MNIEFQRIAKSNWLTALALGVLFFITDIYLLKDIINTAFPIGDEFSLAVESNKNPMNWIKEGYANYFNVYKEYFEPNTNFIRPVANLLYKIFSFFPNPFTHQLIFVNYLTHSMLCILYYVISISLNNTNKFSIGLAIAGFFAPAFWLTAMVAYPSFSLDAVATILGLLSLIALSKNQFLLGLLLLVGSILTKETALPLSIVWVIIGLQRWNLRVVIFGFIPLLVWFLLRMLAFNSLIGGTYTFMETSPLSLISRIVNLATLPLGNLTRGDLKVMILDGKINLNLFYLVINSAVWILTFKFLLKFKPQISNLKDFFKYDLTIFTVALAGSILYYCLIGGDVRFSYLIYALWLIVLCGIQNSRVKNLIILLLIGSSALSMLLKPKDLTETNKFIYSQSKIFINYLMQNNFDGETYVLNDFIGGFSSQENIATFSGSQSKLLRGSSISIGSCEISEIKQIQTKIISNLGGEKHLKIDLPRCAVFLFEGVQSRKVMENMAGTTLRRNDNIKYRFNNLEIRKSTISQIPIFEYGNQMEVFISSKANVLYYDFYNDKWVFLK